MLSDAKETSVDAAILAVLSNLDTIFFALLLTVFGSTTKKQE